MYNTNIREEELKNKVATDYFWHYDNTKIIGNVDFCVAMHKSNTENTEAESLLWAEAKKGHSDIYKSLVQLILTIGRARTFDKHLPPVMLGAFDAEKISFVPYNAIQDIFYLNDFNWNVTPSNHNSKEFKLIFDKVNNILDNDSLIFFYKRDDKDIKRFIKRNFIVGKWGITKNQIDKNNFIVIYNKWLQIVKPTIAVNWELAKKKGVIDGDFYLADLLSQENRTLKDKLFVVLRATKYELNRHKDEYGAFVSGLVEFNDKQKAHNQFWNKYERPPKEEYWDYIIERRDLLVPQDVRERKGSFFTPQIWVELSQKYIADVLGENWQDEYYVWDCAAGTGNLLTGLTNKYNIWASTLDKQDVEVMHDRIKNGANLLEEHVFQFDFLNDDFTKLPLALQKIINDPEKRKKLVLYINPPYAEATTAKTVAGTGKNKAGVATNNSIYNTYSKKIGKASNEIFTQFLIRIYCEIPTSMIANFSTLKNLQSLNFRDFREQFQAKLEKIFLVPASSFDNVKGKFPIGFFIWNSQKNEQFQKINADVYNEKGEFIQKKLLSANSNSKSLNRWFVKFQDKINDNIGLLSNYPPDFQNQLKVFIQIAQIKRSGSLRINRQNLVSLSIYFAVRHCIAATWLNDRDQFLYPNNGWQSDKEFQNNCLVFTLFHGQNRISSDEGINHWIPFSEDEVNAREKFDSNFMSDFINGKLKTERQPDLYNSAKVEMSKKLEFSPSAQAVFAAGTELWKYYHKQENCNVNASFYDIRVHFQGKNAKGRMNSKSENAIYTKLLLSLRNNLKLLAKEIEPKIYKYEFLKK